MPYCPIERSTTLIDDSRLRLEFCTKRELRLCKSLVHVGRHKLCERTSLVVPGEISKLAIKLGGALALDSFFLSSSRC